MADQNRRIKVTDLDFDQIKTNLKDYLKGQDQFTDYDFEGSGLSVLLDVLAYNTHYNALYHNMTVNEMFLDSAQKRSSVVSIAKMLGYNPRSAVAPKATIQITVANASGNPSVLEIPAQTPFKTNIDGSAYTFYTRTNHIATRSLTNTYVFPSIELIQGKRIINTYTQASGQLFDIENPSADISTLVVRVQEDPNSSARTSYILGESIADVSGETRAYFYREKANNTYEVYFGDGIVGFKPPAGSRISLEYYVTEQDQANGARLFTYSGATFGGGQVNILTLSHAAGGSAPESIDSIKFNAPRSFAAQNRAVTADDYKVIIPQLYSNVEAISVWGGEENDPPIYGKAFICIRPKTGATLTQETKNQIVNNIIKEKNIVSIIPEVVDPSYINIILDSAVYYNSNATSFGATTISTIVADTILAYNRNELNKFDSVFRLSKLSREIDNADPSIVSNVTKITLRYEFSPNFNTVAKYTVNLNNPIYNEGNGVRGSSIAITSSGFTLSGNSQVWYLEDDAIGNLRLYYVTTGNQKVFAPTPVGTVNYAHGTITLSDLSISSGDPQQANKLVLYVQPSSYDVVSVRDQLAYIREQDIKITSIPDRVASGESSSGSGYVFTPNR
jgi:hypothetical protein